MGFKPLSIWLNLAIFSVGADVIRQAGTRLARSSEVIVARTGMQPEFIGMIERRSRTALGMGFDSIAVVILYAGTAAGLYLIG